MNAIEVREVIKNYGNNQIVVLEKINMTVPEGSMYVNEQ